MGSSAIESANTITNKNAIKIENLKFTYPKRSQPALDNVNLTVKQGEFVVLCGKSGCGKTTMLRQLKPSLMPYGKKSGRILFNGTDLTELSQREASSKIGFVMQSPENQIVTDKVWHELSFGLESLGYNTSEIRLRVAEMASFFGIQTWFYKNVTELSGGQKQLLALASVMAMQPSLLILDEPTSQLDPIAASEFLATVSKINRELGVTVILTEHRLEEVFPLCDRVIVMSGGQIIADDSPRKIGMSLKERGNSMFLAMPAATRLWFALSGEEYNNFEIPVTVRDGREYITQYTEKNNINNIINTDKDKSGNLDKTPAIELSDVWFKYAKDLPDVVKGVSFKAYSGEITAILGGNGTGKTSMLSLIPGINKPYNGKIKIKGEEFDKIPKNKLFDKLLGVLPQNPQALFVGKTVEEDLLEILSDVKASDKDKLEKVYKMAELCEISGLLKSHPYDLSGGEQQRSALAKVLLLEPSILLLDEPTKGFDAEFKIIFAGILKRLTEAGVCIVMVSHDIEFCAEYADKCALFFDGNIVTDGTPREFFSGNTFYTSSANRIARHIIPNAVTVNDIIKALVGNTDKAYKINKSEEKKEEIIDIDIDEHDPQFGVQTDIADTNKLKLSKRTLASVLIILLAIPVTVYVGSYFFGDRSYYFVSLLIILETMIPFLLVFESRKPQARELVIIAVMCAIAVTGRAAFFMLPQFKPVVAIVIISGVAFGGETGFLVGAMTAFVSNMFFGQGPWTPWQMFSFGIIGFLAGVLFQKSIFKRSRIALCLYGGIATLFLYGILMDSSMVLVTQSKITGEMFFAAFFQGVMFNIIHSCATIIFLAIISKPLLEKLDRIKIKYGLIER